MKRTWRDVFIYQIGKRRGYAVRLRVSTGLRSQFFGAAKYGGPQAALRAARRRRDELLKEVNYPPLRRGQDGKHRPAFATLTRGNNASGVVGIHTNGAAWIAFYHPRPHKQKARSFSINKYGYEGARAKAVAWRTEMLKRLR